MNTTVGEGLLQLFIEMNIMLPKLHASIEQFEDLVSDMKQNITKQVFSGDIETYYQTSVQLQNAREEMEKIETRYKETEALIATFMEEHRIEYIVAKSQAGEVYNVCFNELDPEKKELVLTAAVSN
jgi:hypothetical protein